MNDQVFNFFDGIDNEPDFAFLKDEIMAIIAGGPHDRQISKILELDLYKHLFENFSDEKRAEIKLLLHQIDTELRKVRFSLRSDNAQCNSLLNFLLLDVPLSKFPDRLKTIAKFYGDMYSRHEFRDLSKEEIKSLKARGRMDKFLEVDGQLCDILQANRTLVLGITLDEQDLVKRRSVEAEISRIKNVMEQMVNEV